MLMLLFKVWEEALETLQWSCLWHLYIKNSDVARFEREAQAQIEKYCRGAFVTCTQSGSDALQIGKHIARRSNAQYSKIKADWKSLLPASILEIKVNCECKKINDNAKI